MLGRTPRQCRDRYNNCLDPEKRSKITKEQVDLLRRKIELLGSKFIEIQKNLFPNRTASELKATHKKSLKKSQSKKQTKKI